MLPFYGYNRLTSGYKLPQRPQHAGYDVVSYAPGAAVPCDSVVRALADGSIGQSTMVVSQRDRTWEWGHFVRLDTADGQYWVYSCHLARRLVQPGAAVKKGDAIGIMGNTGKSEGAHVHLEVRRAGGDAAVDPRVLVPELANAVGVVEYAAAAQRKLKILVALDKTVSSKMVDEGVWALMGKDGVLRGYHPGGDARMARAYTGESLSAVFEDMKGNLQPGEVIFAMEDAAPSSGAAGQ